MDDISASINNTELAKRNFRVIASIAGLIFQGFPDKNMTFKHLQASSSMIYKVFEDYDPDNLLLKQANNEVLSLNFEQERLTKALERINTQEIVVKKLTQPTPFCFPIMVDRLREKFTTVTTARIAKMQLALMSNYENSLTKYAANASPHSIRPKNHPYLRLLKH